MDTQNEASPFLFLLPSALDVCASFLNFSALTMISASSYQILKMLTLIFVVFLSVMVLKRSYKCSQYLAVLVVMGGLTIVSWESIIGAD